MFPCLRRTDGLIYDLPILKEIGIQMKIRFHINQE